MTEFSTNNDISNKSHPSSQPLQNSPRHFHTHHHHQHNSSQHFANINKQLTYTHTHNHNYHQHNNKNNQQTLPLNSSSANIANIHNASATYSPPSSATHSPLHYKKPLNSPNNSPYAYAAAAASATTATAQQHQQQQQHLQLQQHLRLGNKFPSTLLTQTQYQRHLNDLLLQQQHLQQQQQQLLSIKSGEDGDDAEANAELSEESLKQNVAIVLSNLDRYNNALRSIILNEQVNSVHSSSSVFFCEDDDDADGHHSINGISFSSNNNFLLSSINSNAALAAMAAPATPESDYNSNATTPGSRSNNILPCIGDSNQQHLVGFAAAAAAAAACAGGGVGGNNIGGNNGGGIGGVFGNNIASNNLNCSLASSHDFTHDNSDYQWFLDYGYRDGCSGMQRSVLSSLSASYNALGDLIYYEDLAKNLDANLAEVDMESFRAEDIHSLLSHLPSYCKSLGGGNSRLQQSLLLQQQQQQQLQHQQQHILPSPVAAHLLSQIGQPHHHNHVSQTSTTSSNELIDNSFCKSELLFSPVKESHISVDSLDMDAYPDDGDIILTCKANKDNYTIAFEGSVLYSDESFYAEPNEIAIKNNKQNFINLHSNLEDIVKRKALEVSMSRSEQAFTTRHKLQKSNTTQLQRYPSGNNNTSEANVALAPPPLIRHTPQCTVRKSNSLPNLRENATVTEQCNLEELPEECEDPRQQLNVSQAGESVSSNTIDDCPPKSLRNLLPMCQMPISCNSTSVSISERLSSAHCQQQQLLQLQHRHKHRCCCAAAVAIQNSATTQQTKHISGSTSSGASSSSNPPPAFNLVKLFIKQKSSNCSNGVGGAVADHEPDKAEASTCMDVSSGCWPSSDAAASSAENSSSSSLEQQRMRKKSMNDSGKGSALSRHDEEDMLREQRQDITPSSKKHLRHEAVFYADDDEAGDSSSSPSGSLTVTNSPAHHRRSMPVLRNPQLNHLTAELAVGSSGSSGGSLLSSDPSRSNSEQLTQVYRRTESTNSRAVSNASSSEMITRSMQTSCGGSLSARSSLNERFRCVPPSFLAKLNKLGEERQAPIYVIYPNYALPDLGFVKTHNATAAVDVIFSPFNYKMAVGTANSSGGSSTSSLKKRFSLSGGRDEEEILKTMDYKHVVDWTSLAMLLPLEYRRRLKHIPEIGEILRVERDNGDSSSTQRPLFCMTPPIRRTRTHLCDCAQYFQQQQQQQQQTVIAGAEEGGSSSSGSSNQPSSGYRGSSTLLTDSELDHATAADPLKQMYVYQYAEQRMDEVAPAAVARAPPQPMPRGILRKSASQQSRTKRNSMIEPQSKLSKLEKRRSLQEPPYPPYIGSSEELYEVFEEVETPQPSPRKERLSRKDLDARARAENFLSSLPRSELKYYAEIAAILESSTGDEEAHHAAVPYDAAALKKEVSRALSQQKKVSFNDQEELELAAAHAQQQQQQQQRFMPADVQRQRFSTPPNSPNISMAGARGSAVGQRMHSAHSVPRLYERKKPTTLDENEQRKIESNRFKRLQIQWELMSKDSSMLKDLANVEQQTKSGGSTPTSATAAATAAAAAAAAAHKSRIPRPVSYPAGKRTEKQQIISPKTPAQPNKIKPCVSPQIARISQDGKSSTRSPSRIVPPKRYSIAASPSNVKQAITTTTSPTTPTATAARARTPTSSRTAVTAPNTPKRRVQSPRTIPRVR